MKITNIATLDDCEKEFIFSPTKKYVLVRWEDGGDTEHNTVFDTEKEAIKEGDYIWSKFSETQQKSFDRFVIILVNVDDEDGFSYDDEIVIKDYKL